MIRPVVDEDKLRNLNEIDLSEMRPEFADQAINLRKRIFSRVKVKDLDG